jgi:hypothetical protein
LSIWRASDRISLAPTASRLLARLNVRSTPRAQRRRWLGSSDGGIRLVTGRYLRRFGRRKRWSSRR